MEPTIERPRVVSREEWLEERRAHLAREKELTRASDRLAEERRALPWVRVEKEYAFDAPRGRVTLSDLFQGRSQLVLTHFMFGPGWKEGCVGCSFGADHMAGARLHLEQHDVSIVYVSRAPLAEIEPFRKRMGWTFPWVSSFESAFNYDFGVSFTPEQVARGERAYNFGTMTVDSEDLSGVSVFYRDDAGGDLPHVLDVRTRQREEPRRVHVPRPDPEGPQRVARWEPDGLGPPPRPLRRGRDRPVDRPLSGGGAGAHRGLNPPRAIGGRG